MCARDPGEALGPALDRDESRDEAVSPVSAPSHVDWIAARGFANKKATMPEAALLALNVLATQMARCRAPEPLRLTGTSSSYVPRWPAPSPLNRPIEILLKECLTANS